MYSGTNPTALQSQEWLITALVSLMKETDYNKIKIGTICKKADLSRQTFYNFFDTKEDILRFCLRRDYEKYFSCLCEKQSISMRDIIEAFTIVLDTNRVLLQSMITNRLDGIIYDEIARCVELFANKFSPESEDKSILIYGEAFLSGALARILLVWFQQENPISKDELCNFLISILNGDYFKINIKGN